MEKVANITIKVKHNHLHFQQNDPINGALQWITLPLDNVKELITILKKIDDENTD